MKTKLLYAFAAMLFITACNQKPDNSSGEPEANKKLITDYFVAFNKHDFKQMASYYTDDALFLDPSFGKKYVHQSHQQTTEKYTQLAGMFPDIKDNVQGIYLSGDKVTVEFISTGTGKDGKAFTLPICTVFMIKDGKIVSDATYYDM